MSRIGIGAAQFGIPYGLRNLNPVKQNEVNAILYNALLNNINVVDTAIAYGRSEEALGDFGLEDFKIITKLPAVPEGTLSIGNWIDQQFKASLSRLQVDKVYGFLLHRPEQLLTSNGSQIYEALKILKEKGMIKKIGLSVYSPNILESITNNFGIDIIQSPLNVFDQRLYNSGWMKRLKSMGVEIHTRSIFLQGLLLIEKGKVSAKFSKWSDKFKKWHNWLLDNNISAFEASVNFAFSFGEIDRVIVGIRNANEILELADAEKSINNINIPDFSCDDENLITPSNWYKL